MKTYLPFVIFWLVDSLLLLVANALFPASFVLGTYRFNSWVAIAVAGFLWTAIVWFSEPLVSKMGFKVKGATTSLLFYFLANLVALWIVARMAPLSGLGVSSSLWVAVLALVADVAQWFVWSSIKKAK